VSLLCGPVAVEEAEDVGGDLGAGVAADAEVLGERGSLDEGWWSKRVSMVGRSR
jgi:hypothetical protein